MSTATFPAGTYNFDRPSAGVRLTRRGRLARTLLVLSLSVVLGAGFAMKAGAGDAVSSGNGALSAAKINGSSDVAGNGSSDVAGNGAKSYVVVTVASGETLWSLASAMADGGDVQALVAEIASANSLNGVDVSAGQKLRIPVK